MSKLNKKQKRLEQRLVYHNGELKWQIRYYTYTVKSSGWKFWKRYIEYEYEEPIFIDIPKVDELENELCKTIV